MSGEGLEQLMIEAHGVICETWSGVMQCDARAAWLWVLVFSDDDTEDRSSRIWNVETPSSQLCI